MCIRDSYEINLEVVDEQQAAHMEEIFRTDLEHCHELTLEEWQRRAPHKRLVERVLQPLQVML